MPRIGVEVTKAQVEHSAEVCDKITDDKIAIGKQIEGVTQGQNSISIGKYAGQDSNKQYGIAIGSSSTVNGDYAIAIGRGAQAKKQKSIAIGDQAVANGENAVQIGQGQNTTAETVKIKSTTILDPTGKIPFSAFQENEVVGLSVNASNHLIVTYAGGTTADLGEIGGATTVSIDGVTFTIQEFATFINNKVKGLENGYRFTVDGVEYIGKDTFDSNGNPIFEYQEVE